MRLDPGTYLGKTLWARRRNGLLLTLSHYEGCETQPWHSHANPTFFVLLAGEHRDQTRRQGFDQPTFSLAFHPVTEIHAGQVGARGMRGLNLEYEDPWLERHGLCGRELGGYRLLQSPGGRLDAIRLLSAAYQADPCSDADLEMQALELLAPLAPGHIPISLGTFGQITSRFHPVVGMAL